MTKRTSPTPIPELLPFRLDSISEVPPPDGSEGTWHQYVITQGSNTITGLRQGTAGEVSVLLATMIERLNERFGKQQAKLRR